MKITNISKGLRGVHTTTGLIYLDPGKSTEREIMPGNLERLRVNADFQIEGDTAPAPDADRAAAIRAAIDGLDPEQDYTAAGLPKVEAINALMPDGAEPVTAAERDAAMAED